MVFQIYKNGMCGCQGFRITIVATHPTQWGRVWPFNDIMIYQGATFKHLKRKKSCSTPILVTIIMNVWSSLEVYVTRKYTFKARQFL